jgi:UDP-N-acetylmuramate: L-alanyl-gamma-D-glutamyl-meso-diaminopimelate ligase
MGSPIADRPSGVGLLFGTMGQMQKVHIIGMCGVGMSATALLLTEAGWQVTGSDAECYGPPLDILARAGLTPRIPYAPSNIPEDVDCFVIGRNAKLTPEENEEVRAALATGKPVYSFPQMLGQLTEGRHNVVVAGSYGKSTVTSLVAHILRHAGVDAGYFVGAEPTSLPAPSSFGSDPTFVLEGDEYPSAHDDARSKFLHLHPQDVILTSIVHDHVNVYPTFADYQAPFRELLTLVPDDGIIVACADESGAIGMAENTPHTVIPYGIDNGAYRATNIEYGETTRFTLLCPDEADIELTTTQLGRHNVEDIVAASAYVRARNLVSREALPAAVASFAGVRRRLDNIAPGSSVPVYEGFGSSYEKARAAIAAIALHYPDRRLVVVFEPHTFGWRNRANLSWYDDVFTSASVVCVAPPEAQGAGTHDQLTHDEIMDRVQHTGVETLAYDPAHPENTVGKLMLGDVVLVLTSGSLEGSLVPLATLVRERFS